MSDFWLVVFLCGVVAGIVYLATVSAESYRVSERVLDNALQFSAGLIIALVAFSLMPPAVENGPILFVVFAFFVGGTAYVLMEFMIAHRMGTEDQTKESPSGSVGFYSVVLIDLFVDAVVIGVGSALTIKTGLLIAIGMTLQMAPLAFVAIATAKQQGLSSEWRRNLAYAFVGCVLAGGIVGYGLLRNQPEAALLTLIALASGFLVTAVTQGMIPEITRKGKVGLSPIFFVIGLTVYALVSLVF